MTDRQRARDDDTKSVAGELRIDRYVGRQDLTRWKSPIGRFLARRVQWVSNRLGPHAALVLILVFGALAAVALTIASASIYDAVVEGDGAAALDRPLLDLAISLRNPGLDVAVTALTNIAGPIGMPVLAVAAIGVLAFTRRSWTPVILITSAGGGSLLMTIAGKRLIGRGRPPLIDAVPPFEYSASFPSGHTLNAVVIAGIVAYLLVLRQRSGLARMLTISGAIVFALAIGASRIFLGHHWFTDVLVAVTLGLAWLAMIITAHRLYLTARAHRHEAVAGELPATSPGSAAEPR